MWVLSWQDPNSATSHPLAYSSQIVMVNPAASLGSIESTVETVETMSSKSVAPSSPGKSERGESRALARAVPAPAGPGALFSESALKAFTAGYASFGQLDGDLTLK
ncbi:unnamed protein product, partial [Symbiodinium sp. CCMP2456]